MTKNAFFEDATSDATAYRLVSKYVMSVYNLLYNPIVPGSSPHLLSFNGREVMGIWSRDVPDCPVEFLDLLLVFDSEMEAGCDGEFRQIANLKHQGYSYTSLIMVRVKDNDIHTISSLLIKNLTFGVLSHELIHHLDNKRIKGRGKTTYDVNDANNDLKRYANDPMESNAFFQEIASPLTSRLEYVKSYGPDSIALFSDIEPNFSIYLKSLFTSKSKLTTRIWNEFSQDRKRRCIARLHALHSQVIKLQNEYIENQNTVVV